MPRTPIASRLQEAGEVAREAVVRGVETERVWDERRARRTTRREFLRDAGLVGGAIAGAGALGRLVPAARAASTPRVVVVGAGLAGLTCAYRLRQAGIAAAVHEAHPTRVGGRCWSIRDAFGGQIAEHGGELIDQGHTHIRQLAQELGLSLDNLLAAEANGTEAFYSFDGTPYTVAQASDDLKGIWQQIHKDVAAAGYPTLFDSYTPRGFELDHMSIVEWLDAYVPNGGAGSKLGQLLDVAYNIEYGAESSEQSVLNMLYLLGYTGPGQFRVFGKSNEKYHVTGGNDQIPQRLATQLAGQITTDSVLTSIKLNSGGSYTLTFKQGRGSAPAVADHVVLALPFSLLREASFGNAGFEPLKVTAIEELPMGTNSKLHVQFSRRHWRSLGCNGETYADTGYQSTWEVTRAQGGTAGILVDYTGGDIGASFGRGDASSRASEFLAQLEPVLQGISAHWNRRATLDFWTTYPWTKGSYSYWKVGQYTKFSGMESRRQGNCHFAGEHTSQDFQGYLNGAVETGERAAAEILGDLK